MPSTRFARFAWFNVLYTIFVILWGAFVRATGSGAGCGANWPNCQGQVIPDAPEIETLIEYTHRLTSGLALVFVIVLLIWSYRAFTSEHVVRKSAWASVVFMLAEAAIGAMLVLLELVAEDDSSLRAVVMALHLCNTFFLLAALTLTAWWAEHPPAKIVFKNSTGALHSIGFLFLLFLGASGAITALGDTLFPQTNYSEGLKVEASPVSMFLLRLRIIHPVAAVLASGYLLFLARYVYLKMSDTWAAFWALTVFVITCIQLVGGIVNVMLQAPLWMQLTHLLFSDLLWVVFVLQSFESLQEKTK